MSIVQIEINSWGFVFYQNIYSNIGPNTTSEAGSTKNCGAAITIVRF